MTLKNLGIILLMSLATAMLVGCATADKEPLVKGTTTTRPAAVNAQQAVDYFGDKVATYLDAVASPKGEASTILDLSQVRAGQPIRVLRLGALSLERIRSVIGDVELKVD